MARPSGFLARVTCKQCGKNALIEHTSFQDAFQCGCCPENHDHDAAANACPSAGVGHDGAPCGPQIEGCTVCRPITIDILQLGAPLSLGV